MYTGNNDHFFFESPMFGGSTRERNYLPREIIDQAHTTGTVIPIEIELTTTKDSL